MDLDSFREDAPASDFSPKIQAAVWGSADRDAARRWLLARDLASPQRCPLDRTADGGKRTGFALPTDWRGRQHAGCLFLGWRQGRVMGPAPWATM